MLWRVHFWMNLIELPGDSHFICVSHVYSLYTRGMFKIPSLITWFSYKGQRWQWLLRSMANSHSWQAFITCSITYVYISRNALMQSHMRETCERFQHTQHCVTHDVSNNCFRYAVELIETDQLRQRHIQGYMGGISSTNQHVLRFRFRLIFSDTQLERNKYLSNQVSRYGTGDCYASFE